ncbi:competence type IV pilus major pilin ComGC [Alkalibacillus haloalkaliphilus]|uniref:competence type IV pilus major pilin ComGC n=1 Tax=Alkalibacillus haloalkaliphilus TaxID=94136 RepID=UPI0029354F3B|nr:competence type IV pilus major pilin ComGC [Alkalibacillus haloalkaliphilus]MDV2580976.1 competence type IV pilus major pilin ComGC [Alkalibacillus haloalkaliphilus]
MVKNNKGFTLIEMLIVLFIISVLLILTIPNVIKHNSFVDDTGCEAYVDLVQSQAQLYKLEEGSYPSELDELVDDYIPSATCPDESELLLNNGRVTVANED